MIKRDLIPRNSLQLYHTEASKSESQSINVNAVEKELQEMKIFKRDVSGHAQLEIKKLMVQAAAHVQIKRVDGELVQTFAEIGNVWKYWNKMNIYDIPAKMFYVMYGWFDENPQWNKEMENAYMLKHGMKYEKADPVQRHRGHKEKLNTICMLNTVIKNDHVKMLNRKTLKTHQTKITITVRDGSGSKSDYKKRRKKVSFKNRFYRIMVFLKKKNQKKKKKKKFR